MKKLYVNISDIHIKGNVFKLTEVVTSMDVTLQKMSQDTEEISSLVSRYSVSNRGEQFKKMVDALFDIRSVLYDASLDLNEMQNEIALYQNKILKYEGYNKSVAHPNKHVVERYEIKADQSEIQFKLEEMIDVQIGLEKYSAALFYNLQSLIRSKNDIGQIWLDTQYRDFADFIDEISMDTLNSLKSFNEYVEYLKLRIKELSE